MLSSLTNDCSGAFRCELQQGAGGEHAGQQRFSNTQMDQAAGVWRVSFFCRTGARAKTKTLYDLLGALPHDDTEGLRTAFRRAVKGTHPDIRPGDPEAALRFREIVRANEILGDAEQRAVYDYLLQLARVEQELASQHTVAAWIRKAASGAIAFAGASVVTVGGYLLFLHVSAAMVVNDNRFDLTMRISPEMAATRPTATSDTSDKGESLAKREDTSVPGVAIVPGIAKQQRPAANVAPAHDPAASELGSPLGQGNLAYRNGGLNDRIAYLDRSIQFDPEFLAAAYIDHDIFFRPRRFDRTFARIAPAKRVTKEGRSKSTTTIAAKPHLDHAAIATSLKLSRRRAVAQDLVRVQK